MFSFINYNEIIKDNKLIEIKPLFNDFIINYNDIINDNNELIEINKTYQNTEEEEEEEE